MVNTILTCHVGGFNMPRLDAYETSTRLPLRNPLLPNTEAPALQAASGVLFLLYLTGATVQVLRIRSARRLAPA